MTAIIIITCLEIRHETMMRLELCYNARTLLLCALVQCEIVSAHMTLKRAAVTATTSSNIGLLHRFCVDTFKLLVTWLRPGRLKMQSQKMQEWQ